MGEQAQRKPRRDHESDCQRQQHADRGIDWNRPHVRTHQTGNEGHRQQRGNDGKRGEDGWPTDFTYRGRDDFAQARATEALVAVDIFDNDDRIVDKDADREDQRKQRNAVDREAHRPRGEQSQHQGDDHRRTDDDRFTPAEREQDQQDHRHRREHELLDQLVGLVTGSLAIVAGCRKLHIGRNDNTGQRLQARSDGAGDIGGIAAGFLGDRESHRRCIAAGRSGLAGGCTEPDVAIRQIGAGTDLRDIRKEDGLALVETDDECSDIGCAGQEAAGGDRHAGVLDDAIACLADRIGRAQRAG